MMYLNKNASKARIREAENARRNRLEIVKALSTGQVTRRELMKWGIFTATGTLAMTNGLSPFAHSQVLPSIPTGTPPSPLFTALPFDEPLMRLPEQKPVDLEEVVMGTETMLAWKDMPNESWHTEFSMAAGTPAQSYYTNPLTGRGPMEGRPPGEYFAHQRWMEYLPKKGYIMSLASPHEARLHHNLVPQYANKLWCFGSGNMSAGMLPPPLIKMRYG